MDAIAPRRRLHPGPRRPRALHVLLTGFVAVLTGAWTVVSVATAPPASAHDALVSTSPADGSRVRTMPAEVVLTFEEPPAAVGSSVLVTGPRGGVQHGTPQAVGVTLHQSLGAGAPAGRYWVAWRITSGDGHVVSGTFVFTAAGALPGTFVPAKGSTDSSGSGVGARMAAGAGIALALVAGVLGGRRRRRYAGRPR